MDVYANLIYMNCSSHATKTTKAKKPYLEKLILRNLHAGFIPPFETVGLFPNLSDVGVIFQLQMFHSYYTNPTNKKQTKIRSIAKWLG